MEIENHFFAEIVMRHREKIITQNITSAAAFIQKNDTLKNQILGAVALLKLKSNPHADDLKESTDDYDDTCEVKKTRKPVGKDWTKVN